MPRKLPHESERSYLVYAGTGTDLIFNHGIELPGFASFPLLEKPETRAVLASQMQDLIDLAAVLEMGCILDAPTWMANADRASPLGYNPQRLVDVNRDAVALVEDLRTEAGREDILVSACIGPRHDPYADIAPMTTEQARAYHSAQMNALKETSVDLVSAYTFNQTDEAAGCVLAAQDAGLPIIMSLVVETDGCLSDGTRLVDAVDKIDEKTDVRALFYMVNCAHPSHFAHAIGGHSRLRGIVANASSCSHAELNESETLDDGDPAALAAEVAAIARDNPAIKIFGGCCGTDMRHLRQMGQAVEAG